jgi:hypothetical protein
VVVTGYSLGPLHNVFGAWVRTKVEFVEVFERHVINGHVEHYSHIESEGFYMIHRHSSLSRVIKEHNPIFSKSTRAL